MVKDRDYERLFEELSINDFSQIFLNGMAITVKIFDQGAKLALATSVYEGGNYIPQSVRRCLSEKNVIKNAHINTFLKVDEEQYQISLNYLGYADHLTTEGFQLLVEEFNEQADEWRLYLDEHDKHDLVHIRSVH